MLTLAPPTALVTFAIFLVLQLIGIPIGRSGQERDLVVLALAALMLAALAAAVQIAALALLRLLPWSGPRLAIEAGDEGDELRRVFE